MVFKVCLLWLHVVPLEYPTNVTWIESSLGSLSVELTWDAVSQSPDTVRGFFIGYRVCANSFDYSCSSLAYYSCISRYVDDGLARW